MLEFYYHVENPNDLIRSIINDIISTIFMGTGTGMATSVIRGIYFKIFMNYKLPAFIGRSFKLINKWYFKGGKYLWFKDNVTLFAGGPLVLGNSSCLAERSTIWSGKGGVVIGKNFFLGMNSYISAIVGKVTVGDDVMIADGVSLYTWNHNFEKNNNIYRKSGGTIKDVKIGNNCWIGSGVRILAGTDIGSNCVVAAGSVLTGKKYPKGSLIAGVPGKVIKKI